jgi:hypothetical protein
VPVIHVRAMRRTTIADRSWCSSPLLRPTLGQACRRIAHADQMAIVPSRLGLDHLADAAVSLHEVVDLVPPGRNHRGEFQRSPAGFLSTRPARSSQSPRRPDSGANPGALFITGNQLVAPYGAMKDPDRLIHSQS